MTRRLRALFARRAGRWGYVPALPVLAVIVLLARRESALAVLYLLGLLAVCTGQLFRPTLIGWALLFVMFVLSTASILSTAMFYVSHGVPIEKDRYVLLQTGSALPSATLFLARPRTQADERGAVLLALTLATLVIAPLFVSVF